MQKTINIDGIEVALRCSGATYIRYRETFKDDLFSRFQEFAAGSKDGNLPDGAVETLTRAAYIMATQAGEVKQFEEWCDQFSLMGLANSLTAVSEILTADRDQTTEAKKKKDQQSAE